MDIFKQKKGDSSVGTAISVIISVVLGGLILMSVIYLIDNVVSQNMAQAFNNQQINISRVVPEEHSFAAGDINKDGVVDISDYQALSNHLSYPSVYICDEDVADIDGDGMITESDLYILKTRLEADGSLNYQKGDANKDGQLDEADVTYIERYLAGWEGYGKPEYGDINGDGVVNGADLDLLKSQIN